MAAKPADRACVVNLGPHRRGCPVTDTYQAVSARKCFRPGIRPTPRRIRPPRTWPGDPLAAQAAVDLRTATSERHLWHLVFKRNRGCTSAVPSPIDKGAINGAPMSESAGAVAHSQGHSPSSASRSRPLLGRPGLSAAMVSPDCVRDRLCHWQTGSWPPPRWSQSRSGRRTRVGRQGVANRCGVWRPLAIRQSQ